MKDITTIQERINAEAAKTAKRELATAISTFRYWLNTHTLDSLDDFKVENVSVHSFLYKIHPVIEESCTRHYQEQATKEFLEKVEQLVSDVDELRSIVSP